MEGVREQKRERQREREREIVFLLWKREAKRELERHMLLHGSKLQPKKPRS